MRVLSLFDGMSCGMLAFQKCGIKIDEYVAYEIDKYAVKTSKHNFPNIKHMGDVFEADFSNYHGFDFIVGGSPCTYWSIAQSKDKRETTASGLGWALFSQYVRALKEAKPKYFIYENNKSMSKQIKESISETFGFEPICINSALVSAQSRQRLYWVGRRNNNGAYDKVDISLPIDKGILLKDVIEDAIPVETVNGKSHTLTAPYYKAGVNPFSVYGAERGRQRIAVPICVNSQSGNSTIHTNCLTTVQKDSLVCTPVRVGHYGKGGQGQRIYSVVGKSVTLSANGGGQGAKTGLYKIDLPDGDYIIRKLTIEECKRLQTVPEWYEFPVSNTQAYKMLGNGWTVDVIVHIIKSILGEE